FVVGAFARDIMLSVFRLESGRRTHDLDIAVAVDNWSQFNLLKEQLLQIDGFKPVEGSPHKMTYRNGGVRYLLDIIPFGGVEGRSSTLAWPPDFSIVMNVAGFRDALAGSAEVEVEPGLVVRVASLAGIAVLKLFAFVDRGTEDSRDARDFVNLL